MRILYGVHNTLIGSGDVQFQFTHVFSAVQNGDYAFDVLARRSPQLVCLRMGINFEKVSFLHQALRNMQSAETADGSFIMPIIDLSMQKNTFYRKEDNR